ncbi:MAG TPA: putative lipid II flippase FtsW [Actinomycetota bacterium]|nr:putative lipid II flippase FtsW [Actinomycetota bacterium]
MLIGLTAGALVLLGLMMILSASSVSSFANYGSSFTFFQKQLAWAVVGILSYVVLARVDYRKLRGSGYPALTIAVGLLCAVLVPGVGVVVGGSARWIGLGPLSFQPSEIAKRALVVFAADVFARKREQSLHVPGHAAIPLLPVLALLGALVILQPDLGTALILGAIGLGMLFVAGARLRYVGAMTIAGTAAAAFAAFAEDYRRARILAFLDPWKDPLDTGYQTIQSLLALGSGGWLGVGLGASRQKYLYIPNAHTDFIFAILGEEVGFLGTAAVLGAFCFLAYLGIQTARRAPDRFGMLLAAGVTIWISVQALVNVGAVAAALPITGVPLPLVSFGGTSLVMTLAGIGILTNVASQARASSGQRRRVPRAQRGAAARGR